MDDPRDDMMKRRLGIIVNSDRYASSLINLASAAVAGDIDVRIHFTCPEAETVRQYFPEDLEKKLKFTQKCLPGGAAGEPVDCVDLSMFIASCDRIVVF